MSVTETIGFSEKPTVLRLGKREKAILKCLNENLELKLIEIIKSCEPSLKYRTFLSKKERKRLEAYYLSSLKSLMRKDLVWKHKKTEKKKLYIWDGGDSRPEWYSTLTSKPTFYHLTNEGLDFMKKGGS